MKTKKLKLLILFLIIVILVITIIIINKNASKKQSNSSSNPKDTSQIVIDLSSSTIEKAVSKPIDGIKVSNVEITRNKGKFITLKLDITNSNSDQRVVEIMLKYYDKSGVQIGQNTFTLGIMEPKEVRTEENTCYIGETSVSKVTFEVQAQKFELESEIEEVEYGEDALIEDSIMNDESLSSGEIEAYDAGELDAETYTSNQSEPITESIVDEDTSFGTGTDEEEGLTPEDNI